jgi:hypothetical protein
MHRAALVVLIVLMSSAWAEQPPRPLLQRKVLDEVIIADYAKESSAKALHPKSTATIENGTLKLSLPAREDLPAVQLWSGAGVNLAKMDLLRFEIENTGARANTKLFVYDESEKKRAAYELPIDPGLNTVALPLWFVLCEGTDERLDVSAVKSIQLALVRQKDAATFQLKKIVAQKVFSDASQIKFFEFGVGGKNPEDAKAVESKGIAPADLFAGATPVSAKTLYDKARGYGLGGENIGARNWNGQFPLLGHEITGQNLSFTLDMPDGDYEAQLVAFGVTWQGVRSVSYRVLAGESAVVDQKMTPEKFYSFDGQYYGANLFYDPNKTLFDQYHRKYFEPARFETKAAGGSIALKFESCGPRTLWLYPKALAEEAREFVECCYAEEGYNLWLKHARMRDHAPNEGGLPPTEADTKCGYSLFARNYQYRVYPSDLPTKNELIPDAGLTVACAPNEFEPVTFVVRPLQDLGATKVSVSELSSGANKLASSNVDLSIVKCVPLGAGGIAYELTPTMLYPYFERVLTKNFNCQYWATLHVPKGTPAGTYTGTISIQPATGTAATIPLSVIVYPFDLPNTKTECGMWNNTAFGSHQIGAFPNYDELAAKLLDAECRNMMEHGLNCYVFSGPSGIEYDKATCTAKLDFHHLDLTAAAVKKNNMPGRHRFGTDGLAKYGLRKKGFTEFSPEFNKTYVNIMTQVYDWMKKNEVNGVLQVTDEPRETDLEDWNYNRRDSIKMLKLARQVSGLQTMVTLMSDKDGFGRPYSLMLPLMDVMATHSWAGSTDIIYLTSVEHIADYWAYNNGFTRFAHGFYLWKSKAMGHSQWVFSWEVCNAHIPVFMPHDTSAAYVFPGGFLNTLKYENVREGIDDHRYLELLQATMKDAPKDSAAVADAQAFLKIVDKFLPEYPHSDQVTGAEAGSVYDASQATTYFDPWRAQIAEYIVAIKESRPAKKLDPAWAMFPKQLAEEQRTVICKLVDKGPKIDGKGSDPLWKDVPEITDFVNLAQAKLAPIQTHVKTVCDGEKLYFLFTCSEPKYGELKAYSINRDEDCWMDDSVEVFMDYKLDKKTYKHIIINCLGTIQDTDGMDPLWNGDIDIKVSKEKGVWRTEFSVTLNSLGADAPKDGTKWGVNLCRNRQPQPSETSSWAFVGHSFHNPEKFGTMEFKK